MTGTVKEVCKSNSETVKLVQRRVLDGRNSLEGSDLLDFIVISRGRQGNERKLKEVSRVETEDIITIKTINQKTEDR